MNTGNSVFDWTNRLAERPEVFPHQLDLIKDQVLLVKLSAAERKAASFLDQRALKQTTPGAWVPWPAIASEAPAPSPTKPAHYIFHGGHCGSTLLSRLLEFAPETECLREPLVLRTLAQDEADGHEGRSFLTAEERQSRLKKFTALWTRGAGNTVVKATSICTDLMPGVLSFQPNARSIFIYNRPEAHLETLLAGEHSRYDLKSFAQIRVQRLRQMTGLDIRLDQLDHAQLAAIGWLSEAVRAELTRQDFAPQFTQVNFDGLLRNPRETLLDLFGFLKLADGKEAARNAIASPVLKTYSKAPDYAYTAETRSALMEQARSRYGNEIRNTLAWIEQLAGQSPPLAAALHRFAS